MKNLVGLKFGRLLVTGIGDRHIGKSGVSRFRWRCICDCGKEVDVLTNSLNSGNSKSCGCMAKEAVSKSTARIKHGMKGSRPYSIWQNMKTRCTYKKCNVYKYYGGRGITYTSKWETFEGFWEDMKNGYEEGLSLDRIDNDNGYYKDNCRWIPIAMQQRNKKLQKSNKTGKTGVYLSKTKYGNYYMANWTTLEGKKKTKAFSVKKYGEEKALMLASECRDRELAIMEPLLWGGFTQ